MPSTEPPFKSFRSTPSPVQDAPEDLSVKKSPLLVIIKRFILHFITTLLIDFRFIVSANDATGE